MMGGASSLAIAQDPSRDYLTIATPHFRVSFTKPLEAIARRVAANAERAYGQLSQDLHPPRGTIEVLVTDDFDFSNGSATPSPSNRIIVYAMPPVTDFGLRYTTDWSQMVVTHELAHIFHLDRVRGHWKLAQYIFGRSPLLFPNIYQPSWLIEGLAVYEESKHAGQGRIEGPEHQLLLRAATLDRHFPRIGDASLARPTFPQGTSAYGYGSLFMAYLAKTRGDSAIRKLVESSSVQLIPYLIDIPARRAFGTSFGAAWSEWRRSLEAEIRDSARPPLAGWTDLARDQLVASHPRWMDSSTISFTGTTGRDVLSLFEVSTDGRVTRRQARQGQSPTVRLPSGDVLFAQYEYVGPYTYRSDLYVQSGNDGPRRLTRGQRLFAPDVSVRGSIIAMQVVEGATRLVRVDLDGGIGPLTHAHPDTLYSEPRWSPTGDRIVASRWIRGGIAQIVTLDSLGENPRAIASARQVMASPSWIPGDEGVAFSNGLELWRVDPATGATSRISNAPSGIFEPEFRDARALAAVTLRADGYRVGVGNAASRTDTSRFDETAADPRLPPLAVDDSPGREYSAFRQLAPRYWVPLAEAGFDGAYLLGGFTEAWDILRRHSWYADVRIPTDNSGINWSAEYQYRGLGVPVLSSGVLREWTPTPVFDRGSPRRRVGTLRRRLTDTDLLATFIRQRVRSSLSFSVGAGLERREYFGDPPEILAAVDSGGIFRTADFPRITAAAAYARYYTPPFAISAEDGFSVAVTARERLRSAFNAAGGASTSIVSAVSLFKAFDLPGYAHHVIALRGAGGWADTRANSYFDVGGVSGGTYQVFPGYTLGEGRRTFPVRGFDAGTAQGIRAAAASMEYRAPLSLAQRSISTLPTFLQRSALTLFADYGIAWCPSSQATRQVCVDPSQEVKVDFASVGGELSVNAGLLSWDSATRLRFGVAVPVHNGAGLGARTWTPYFATGISF